jgi:hypothetical protein
MTGILSFSEVNDCTTESMDFFELDSLNLNMTTCCKGPSFDFSCAFRLLERRTINKKIIFFMASGYKNEYFLK